MREKKKDLLSQGLHQIIHTDQKANAMIQDAWDKSAEMEKQTKEDVKAILADAKVKFNEVSRQAEQEEAARFEELEKQTLAQNEVAKEQMKKRFLQNTDAADQIVGRILARE